MKNILLLIIISIFLTLNAFSQEVSRQEAEQTALEFCTSLWSKPISSSDIERTEPFVYQQQTTFYLINFRNNAGWIMISADKRAYPVLGYGQGESWFSSRAIPPALQKLRIEYSRQILDIRSRKLSAAPSVSRRWAAIQKGGAAKGAQSSVAPLLTTIWSQGCYFNDSCPTDPGGPCGHAVTGCVATAMGQLINYHHFPPKGSGSHSYQSNYGTLTTHFGNTNYQWNLMPDTANSSTPPAQVAAMAQLLSHCGIAVDMMYSAGSSGAYSQDAMNALIHYFNFNPQMQLLSKDNYPDSVWENMLRSSLDSLQPLYYDGSGSGGHAFVCDGYQGSHYFHFNWGWNGSHNGWFLASNLNPGGLNFSMYNSAIFGVKPFLPRQCSGLTDTLSAQRGALNDGSSYQNYADNQNCSWLIQPGANVQGIKLHFYTFKLAGGDTLKIYSGNSTASPLVASYTGDSMPPDLYLASPAIFITFSSDSTSNDEGWSLSYQSEYCSGSQILTGLSGSFSDGSGAFNYNNNSMCTWLINSGSTYPINLSFTDFHTEQGYDFVKVYDGNSSSATLLGNFSGNSLPPTLSSSGGEMFIEFTSDGGLTDKGFEASWYSCPPVAAPQLSNPTFCLGDSSLLSYPAAFDSLVWYRDQQAVNSMNSAWYIHQQGKWWARVFRNGCMPDSTASVSSKTWTPASFKLGSDTILCVNSYSPYTYAGPPYCLSYLWNTGDTGQYFPVDSSIINYWFGSTGSDTLILSVIDSNQCQASDSVIISVVICGAIPEPAHNKLKVYPNPATDELIINLQGRNIDEVILIDARGQLLFSRQAGHRSVRVDIRALSSGVYYLRIRSGQEYFDRKIIKP